MSNGLTEKIREKVENTEFEAFFRETFVNGRNASEVMRELNLPADYERSFLRFMRTANSN